MFGVDPLAVSVDRVEDSLNQGGLMIVCNMVSSEGTITKQARILCFIIFPLFSIFLLFLNLYFFGGFNSEENCATDLTLRLLFLRLFVCDGVLSMLCMTSQNQQFRRNTKAVAQNLHLFLPVREFSIDSHSSFPHLNPESRDLVPITESGIESNSKH